LTIYLHELLEGWVDDAPEVRLSGINLNKYAIEAGEAFVAIQGQMGHGLDDARFAVDAGAVAVIHDGLRALPALDVPVVQINDLGYKLGELASRYYAAPSELMTIAGVTGSNGKTSVAHYLAQSWQRVYGNAGMVGTLGNSPAGVFQYGEHTTPDAFGLQQVLADCASSGIEHLAMEISSEALKQQHVETVQFDVAILTNFGQAHAGHHSGSSDHEVAERLLFTDYAPSFAIINHDDSHGRKWYSELNGGMQMLSFGLAKDAELRAEIQSMGTGGTTFRIDGPWGSERVHTGLAGESNLMSLLASAGSLALLGMPWHRVLHQLEVMQAVPETMTCQGEDPGQAAIFTDYTHIPEALEVAA
jgi:UDP-N-acetylmuramoyl-L-alanyl-D-glutamate--2,6-diaminopimelate ligase